MVFTGSFLPCITISLTTESGPWIIESLQIIRSCYVGNSRANKVASPSRKMTWV